MNKHTQGKWEMDGPQLVGNGYGIGSVNSHNSSEGKANATLIAAAPDLLEALENLLDAYSKPDQRMCCIGTDCGCMGATIYDQAEHYARAAIYRATGVKP